jgi:tetratricopeptide (TPR) repeat protein
MQRVAHPLRTGFVAVFGAAFVFAIAAVSPADGEAQWPPTEFTNLDVLPADIPTDSLVRMMAGFTRALGVRCTYCHVGEESRPLGTYDFAADDKLPKRKARTMLRMVGRINAEELTQLEERGTPAVRVDCVTCHRGAQRPRMLQDIVLEAVAAGGVDSAVAAYRALRAEYYGSFVYDFGEVPLADVAAELARSGSLGDAERLHDLNIEHNPESGFARQQYVLVALRRAFLEGAQVGESRYAAIKTRFGGEPLDEVLLNFVASALLRQDRVDGAVAAFRLNAAEHPSSSAAQAALGDGYAAAGDVPNAIRSYEEAIALDPANADAAEKLRALRERRESGG